MTVSMKRTPARIARDTELSRTDVWALLMPIMKRVPAYIRLGWALIRDPAIGRRHKSLLYFTIIYTVSPLHMLMGPIPVVAQVDSIVLLLLGIRQAIAHCPEATVARHLSRLKLPARQMDRDLNVAVSLAWRTLRRIGRPVGREVAFAGRVAHGFGRRVMERLAEPDDDKQSRGRGGARPPAGKRRGRH